MSTDGGHRRFAPLLVILKRSTVVGLFVVPFSNQDRVFSH